jgi:hypothetical protein
VKSKVLKEMIINSYHVRCDAVRSGIRGFKMGRHLLLQYIDQTFNRTEGDKPRITLLDIAGKHFVIYLLISRLQQLRLLHVISKRTRIGKEVEECFMIKLAVTFRNVPVSSDGGSSDNAVVLSCNHSRVRVSATASLHRVSTQQFYLAGTFMGWDIR